MSTKPLSQSSVPSAETAAGFRRWAIKSAVAALVMAAILFLAAGRLDWPNGWLYVGFMAGVLVIDAIVLPHELLAERSQGREGTKKWDVFLASGMAVLLPLLILVVAGLDKRWRWSPELPTWLILASLMISLVGALLTIWAMRINAFFSSTVRIQSERGHQVVSSGPYRFVRHPGYVGVLVCYLPVPFILGALSALVPTALLVLVTFVRTALEDRTLQAELPGYRNYAQHTRYRLIPGIW
ncbi:MAG TPA: isoprenylcysteine carboxylmethyltransferase family protein [Phototrophicaceae bacterium]|nr:isoprenylcysteine carboxylmethyltransferase family protein [Phototrophicaceae bacterium]